MRTQFLKVTASILAAVFALLCFSPASLAASPVDLGSVKTAMLAEAKTGQLVMEKDSDKKVPVAGLSRLIALVLVCELIDDGALELSDVVTVSEEASRVKGPTAFVDSFEKIEAGELLKAAVMIGAGDAIYALAEATTGSANAFVEQMNQRLEALGVNAVYTSIAEDVALSAADLCAIGAAAAKSKTFQSCSTVYMDEIRHQSGLVTELVNSNRLIRSLTGCMGVGTGSSNTAGYCGVFYVQRGETAYVCAVTGAQNSNERFSTAQAMTDYAFSAYKAVTLSKENEALLENIPVKGGTEAKVKLVAKNDHVLLLKQNESFEQRSNIPEMLFAPLKKDTVVGSIEYLDANGSLIAVVELVPQKDIMQAELGDYIRLLFLSFLHA